ncbi:hypothetical protein H9P43_007927 [Blastocladiella emersonii ATCC 22665]|nr:hypothetical protein H9P43_007927 [Blastocladiella emersonii ATCC 22665]
MDHSHGGGAGCIAADQAMLGYDPEQRSASTDTADSGFHRATQSPSVEPQPEQHSAPRTASDSDPFPSSSASDLLLDPGFAGFHDPLSMSQLFHQTEAAAPCPGPASSPLTYPTTLLPQDSPAGARSPSPRFGEFRSPALSPARLQIHPHDDLAAYAGSPPAGLRLGASSPMARPAYLAVGYGDATAEHHHHAASPMAVDPLSPVLHDNDARLGSGSGKHDEYIEDGPLPYSCLFQGGTEEAQQSKHQPAAAVGERALVKYTEDPTPVPSVAEPVVAAESVPAPAVAAKPAPAASKAKRRRSSTTSAKSKKASAAAAAAAAAASAAVSTPTPLEPATRAAQPVLHAVPMASLAAALLGPNPQIRTTSPNTTTAAPLAPGVAQFSYPVDGAGTMATIQIDPAALATLIQAAGGQVPAHLAQQQLAAAAAAAAAAGAAGQGQAQTPTGAFAPRVTTLLYSYYFLCIHLNSARRTEIAQAAELRPVQVEYWFCNRRRRDKLEGRVASCADCIHNHKRAASSSAAAESPAPAGQLAIEGFEGEASTSTTPASSPRKRKKSTSAAPSAPTAAALLASGPDHHHHIHHKRARSVPASAALGSDSGVIVVEPAPVLVQRRAAPVPAVPRAHHHHHHSHGHGHPVPHTSAWGSPVVPLPRAPQQQFHHHHGQMAAVAVQQQYAAMLMQQQQHQQAAAMQWLLASAPGAHQQHGGGETVYYMPHGGSGGGEHGEH